MIGNVKKAKIQLVCHYLLMLTLLSVVPKLNAQSASSTAEKSAADGSTISSRKPATIRPSSELLSRSLGMSAMILVVGGIILLTHRLVARVSQSSTLIRKTSNELIRGEVLQRIVLNSKQSVYVMRIAGRVMVIGTGSQDAPQLLSEWPIEEILAGDSTNIESSDNQALPIILGKKESAA